MSCLGAFGCDAGRGYFFSKPLPSEAVLQVIDLNRKQLKGVGTKTTGTTTPRMPGAILQNQGSQILDRDREC
jgi:hypothetical protein